MEFQGQNQQALCDLQNNSTAALSSGLYDYTGNDYNNFSLGNYPLTNCVNYSYTVYSDKTEKAINIVEALINKGLLQEPQDRKAFMCIVNAVKSKL